MGEGGREGEREGGREGRGEGEMGWVVSSWLRNSQ